ncbi:MAG: DUF3795 domain-containing protein [Chitinivibrionales bacterium]|nr:DUF3795 domain-containing protein [Chitinivibrionales bacterium]
MPVNDPFASRCGIYCGDCSYREQMNCRGCVQAQGMPFWGTCPISRCCVDREHDNCGACDEFPCALLNKFAYDKDQGDNGRRIENLRRWREAGVAAWLQERVP